MVSLFPFIYVFPSYSIWMKSLKFDILLFDLNNLAFKVVTANMILGVY